MILDFLFLPCLFLIGVITSYQDFKEGKIKNKWIVSGLIYGVAILIVLAIWNLIAEPVMVFYYTNIKHEAVDASWQIITIRWDYFGKVFLNCAIALIIGYALWYFNLWSAGDAKLFFVFSLLLPLKYYQDAAFPYFPSLSLLINTFIPILLFLICQNFFLFFRDIMAFKGKMLNLKERILKLKNSLKKDYYNYLKIGTGYFMIFIFFQLIKTELRVQLSSELQGILFLLIIVFRKILEKFLRKVWIVITIFVVISFYLIINYIFYSRAIWSKLFLSIENSIVFMFVFILISSLLSFVPQKQKTHISFAFWMFLGLLITIFFKSFIVSFSRTLF
ncbi:prepilin peptidase [Patescibacteria group bacterium]|nr:prepilin peptidase [Patescibacteria group bacterium]